jgi:hypothetical protein
MRVGEALFEELRESFAREIGASDVAALEAALRTLVGDSAVRIEAPGWVSHELD